MPHPTPTVPDYVRLARHEWDLDDDGHEVIEHAVAVETDSTLVLAPDGAGGVEFRAESAGGGVTGFATPAVVLGTAAAAGAATTVIRSDSTIVAFDATVPAAIGTAATGAVAKAARRDHVHPTGAGTPSTQALGDTAVVGTGPAAAMTDHKHAMPALSTATPLVESGAGAVGTGVKSSREDHVHPALGAATYALDDLTDVTITSPTASQRLRYDGSLWRNSSLMWSPVMALDPTSGNYLPVTTGAGDAVMVEA